LDDEAERGPWFYEHHRIIGRSNPEHTVAAPFQICLPIELRPVRNAALTHRGRSSVLRCSSPMKTYPRVRPRFIRVAFLLSICTAVISFGAEHPPGEIAAKNAATVWVNPPKAGTLPPGVTHHTYISASMKHPVGYCIYLPPGYTENPTRRYRVVYELHGAGGNELSHLSVPPVLHEGIVSGRWPAMILVMPNGGKNTFYKDSADGKYMGETTIIRELIPHIDATYRTIAARHGRAIEGFSMGARGGTRLAIKFPEMFCSLSNQAGNVVHIADQYDPSKPMTYPNEYLGTDRQRFIDNDTYLLLQKNVSRIKDRLRIQIICGTQDDGHLPTVRDFHAALLKAGVDHTYIEVEGLKHERPKLLALYRTTWFDYHAESFRRAAADGGKGE
jgi:S-formylglutathione hydrolase FrmB